MLSELLKVWQIKFGTFLEKKTVLKSHPDLAEEVVQKLAKFAGVVVRSDSEVEKVFLKEREWISSEFSKPVSDNLPKKHNVAINFSEQLQFAHWIVGDYTWERS